MSTIARDVSDQQFLTQASKTLAASLDYEETLREVAHLAAEHMADWCSVHIVEESGAIRHLATHHRNPEKARWAAEMTGDYPVRAQSERGIPRVLRTGAPELYSDITPELLREAATDERHLELLLAAGLRSAMIVPLKVGSRILGTLTFLTAESGRRYLSEDLPLAEALADRAARAIENAKLYRLAQKEVEERKSAERQVLELNAHLEERVRERTRELQEALLELEAFSYSIAHDLRAPLRSMTGFSEMLAEDYGGKLDEVGRDYTRRIAESARRMDALIQDLLSYSRLAREEVLIEPVDVGSLLEELVDNMAAELRERKAKVELRGPFPTVLGYRTTLLQALTNLLSNAVKFVAPGVEPRVILRSEERSGWGRLWIEDNGLGIDLKYHQTIFGVFQRLHSGEAYPGTGIGLAIVRKAMERMGGKVGLESEVGRGSRFFIELPLVVPGEFGRPPVLRSPGVGRT
jgi:signal transduction histidine kinase